MSVSPLPSTWDACDTWVASLKDAVSSVPLLTGASNYLPWAKELKIALASVRGCLCLLDETPASYLPSDSTPNPSATSLPAAIWQHLDTALAVAVVRSLSPDLAPLFDSIILDKPSCAARTLTLKLKADYGGRSSYDQWESVQALFSQPQGSTPVTEYMTSCRQKFTTLKAAGYDFDRWFLDNLIDNLGPHLDPTVNGLDFDTLDYDTLYAAVRGVDNNHRRHAASTSASLALAASVSPPTYTSLALAPPGSPSTAAPLALSASVSPARVPSADFPCDICQ
ncbi:hypothetical protein B9479_008381, partial [Cryptococcus floricola]